MKWVYVEMTFTLIRSSLSLYIAIRVMVFFFYLGNNNPNEWISWLGVKWHYLPQCEVNSGGHFRIDHAWVTPHGSVNQSSYYSVTVCLSWGFDNHTVIIWVWWMLLALTIAMSRAAPLMENGEGKYWPPYRRMFLSNNWWEGNWSE